MSVQRNFIKENENRLLRPAKLLNQPEELERRHKQFTRLQEPLDKYLYAHGLLQEDADLFFSFASRYIDEVLPIVYTPTVGLACQNFSKITNQFTGLFVTEENIDELEETLRGLQKNIKVAVVTDGERILGLGDLGVGGMGISMGKSILYSLFGGIPREATLPIVLDVGTNNEALLNDPDYLGVRQKRIPLDRYFPFIEKFVTIFRSVFPSALLQWEDFAKDNARALLEEYQDRILCFNDDIQGTAAVTTAVLLAAIEKKQGKIENERILFYGAGSANLGSANLIVSYLKRGGISEDNLYKNIALVDSKGLITKGRQKVPDELVCYEKNLPPSKDLIDIIDSFKPTILIGASAQAGAFDQAIIEKMCSITHRPIIMALSNPTSKAECTLKEAIDYSKGLAIFASGSPFAPYEYEGITHFATQANNLYIYPAMGLAAAAFGFKNIPSDLFLELALTLSQSSTEDNLLPPFKALRSMVPDLSFAIVKRAIELGLTSSCSDQKIHERLSLQRFHVH